MAEGKIIKALSGFYYVKNREDGEIYQCRGRGVFRKKKITPLVGDYVEFQKENGREGYILDIGERKNELVRPPIANVDQAVLVFSAKEPDFHTLLLDRFLVPIEKNLIRPLILITKCDLLGAEEKERLLGTLEVYRQIGYPVIFSSAKAGEGTDALLSALKGNITVFCGQSGVGKTSILNRLDPALDLKTNEISTHLGRGKHTTRHVELLPVGGGLVADTPGFSSLDFTGVELSELGDYFPEISEKSAGCKFRGCLHENEPHCAVKAALAEGEIASFRYSHYIQFLQEIKNRKPRY
ncbi:ribosome small subunit-dependent GTPase A [Heyndrickxia coagulans]|uniref:ribosome small subunit-dependent GTPase A n=1 Tax=Heyndrickxia coagulans TaxID=1398 RepID=UPI002236B01C|nr:ribosome small subunit-dependent GTPase A [Heyndrickxia coagulans]UZH07241.1 ribosome small subunit-dependent GTPase A [Heyndrickxia coagulans]